MNEETQNQLETQMRDWLIECYGDDAECEILELPKWRLEQIIEREFDGGLKEFINCSGLNLTGWDVVEA